MGPIDPAQPALPDEGSCTGVTASAAANHDSDDDDCIPRRRVMIRGNRFLRSNSYRTIAARSSMTTAAVFAVPGGGSSKS